MELFLIILIALGVVFYIFRVQIAQWAVRRFIKRMTGMDVGNVSGAGSQQQQKKRRTTTRTPGGQSTSSPNPAAAGGHIFADDEGSYVDFEEIKEKK